jgi:hypothetical protein
MSKDLWILAILVSMLLVVNSGFILVIQLGERSSNQPNYIAQSVGNVLAGYDPLQVFDKPFIESTLIKKSTTSGSKSASISKKPKPTPTPIATRSALRDVFDDSGRVKLYTINYDTDTITFPDGKTTKIIIDGNINPSQNDYYDKTGTAAASPVTWQQIPYTRFNAYIEQNYYNANQVALDTFLQNFNERYILMENETGWTAEKFNGQKLEIYIHQVSSGCWDGYALPKTEAHIYLSSPFPKEECKKPYYLNGQQQFNNPGQLGDNWYDTSIVLHESLHSISPIPIYVRPWLAEGFSEYNMYNILTIKGDINQETADTYIRNGVNGYRWNDYVANNYRDTTINNYTIQESLGYDITAWMFTMLRDEWGLRFDRFYNLVNNNLETLNKADSQTNWQISDDMTVLDLFGRTLGRNFNGTKFIFRYDGPSGPGWGVRQWVSRDFYADLRTTMALSNLNPQPGQRVDINVTIYNDGQTNLNNVSVRVYTLTGAGEDPTATTIKEQTISLNTGQNILIKTNFTSAVKGGYGIVAYADNKQVKLETNEENNAVIQSVFFGTPDPDTSCPWEKVNGHWIQVCSSATTLIK